MRQKWPNAPKAVVKNLYSVKTARYVLERWDGRSVLSSDSATPTDGDLCIFPLQKPPPLLDEELPVPTLRNLVLVTSKEAQRLSHMKPAKCWAQFDQRVQQLVSQEEFGE